jgi:hypothetical protein
LAGAAWARWAACRPWISFAGAARAPGAAADSPWSSYAGAVRAPGAAAASPWMWLSCAARAPGAPALGGIGQESMDGGATMLGLLVSGTRVVTLYMVRVHRFLV